MASKETEKKAFEKFEELLSEVRNVAYSADSTSTIVDGVGRQLEELTSMFQIVFPKACLPHQYHNQGYRQWNSHIKYNLKKLSEFINFCGSIERDEYIIRPDMTKYVVVNQETRFPEESEEELYLDVRSIRVKIQMMYIDELLKNDNTSCRNGLTKNFLDFVKNDIYTRTSFEEMNNLQWSNIYY